MSLPDPYGEQSIIASVMPECSDAEWDLLREALQIVSARRSIEYSDWSTQIN